MGGGRFFSDGFYLFSLFQCLILFFGYDAIAKQGLEQCLVGSPGSRSQDDQERPKLNRDKPIDSVFMRASLL